MRFAPCWMSARAAVPRKMPLVVRGTPDQIALAEKLVEDLDKAIRK